MQVFAYYKNGVHVPYTFEMGPECILGVRDLGRLFPYVLELIKKCPTIPQQHTYRYKETEGVKAVFTIIDKLEEEQKFELLSRIQRICTTYITKKVIVEQKIRRTREFGGGYYFKHEVIRFEIRKIENDVGMIVKYKQLSPPPGIPVDRSTSIMGRTIRREAVEDEKSISINTFDCAMTLINQIVAWTEKVDEPAEPERVEDIPSISELPAKEVSKGVSKRTKLKKKKKKIKNLTSKYPPIILHGHSCKVFKIPEFNSVFILTSKLKKNELSELISRIEMFCKQYVIKEVTIDPLRKSKSCNIKSECARFEIEQRVQMMMKCKEFSPLSDLSVSKAVKFFRHTPSIINEPQEIRETCSISVLPDDEVLNIDNKGKEPKKKKKKKVKKISKHSSCKRVVASNISGVKESNTVSKVEEPKKVKKVRFSKFIKIEKFSS